jgi:YfiH family protein
MQTPSKNLNPPGTSILTQKYLTPDCFRQYRRLIALQSTRNGGVSEGAYFSLNVGKNTDDHEEKVRENTRLLCAAAGLNPECMVSSEQIHGTAILCAERPGHYHGYDALITDRTNLFLCIFTADCYPVLIYDPQHNASAAIHAGWKGSAGKIVLKTMTAMQSSFNSEPSECLAYIGTGISPEAYEVGREVAMEFPPDCRHRSPSRKEEEKYLLDLGMVNYRQLLATGIPASNIERSPFCTVRNSDRFFSYRRDSGKTGRMVSLIGINSPDKEA